MKLKKRKWLKFDVIAYTFGIITGILVVVFKFGSNPLLGWIIITLGVLSLSFTLFKRLK